MKTDNIFLIKVIILILFAVVFNCCGDKDETNEIDEIVDNANGNSPNIITTDKTEYVISNVMIITGTRFGETQDGGYVLFYDDVKMDIINSWSDTLIEVEVHPAARSGEIQVVRGDGSESNKYYVTIDQPDYWCEMVLIKKGQFVMGDNSSTTPGEKPQHNVNFTYDFFISETPVTQQFYKIITYEIPFSLAPNVDSVPVHYINFRDAVTFCNKLSNSANLTPCYTITGETNITCNFNADGYRLPTEAEWEYVARAGTGTAWGFTGDSDSYLWYYGNNSTNGVPRKVKSKLPNLWGVYDMHGNVYEWCWDNFSYEYYQECINGVTDPTGPTNFGGSKVIRGGSVLSVMEHTKATARESYNIQQERQDIGFRIVRKRT